ncbi:folate-binding protein YgfZ [Ralstonia sp. TCR112]|jgi:folate-binding protein YgfZ|uniref:CAF17-like 4Fe-4S cluster assembly/insertion protein YgfZ n=1 Tax=Ralstonia sp. TCR112 TaxID=2601730 RepID=UPI0011BE3C04|nr:folate-binding protein YgfZ [Ralstonia sp. TCR112]TXD62936.1 folate-binding protein YgfZ [Ralstonia sp. TCR112]
MNDVFHDFVDTLSFPPLDVQFDAATRGSVLCAPTDLARIAVEGADAAEFLHNQLTNAVTGLGLNQARLAGYCSPKGRLLATLLVWRQADTFVLQTDKAIAPALTKRLSMFVLRAKAKLRPMDEFIAIGVAGPDAADALREAGAVLPEPDAVNAVAQQPATVGQQVGAVVRLPDAGGRPRYQWMVHAEHFQDAWKTLSSRLSLVGTEVWDWLSLQAGVPHITLPTQEQFVPQMVNLELLGGVDFRKGCYPGQEVVARSQYRGTLKRRMHRAHVNAPTSAGAEVYSAADPNQPCGMVVNAAMAPDGGTDLLVELKLDALDTAIHLATPDGPALTLQALPYVIPVSENA